jgi:CarboxypepD_reg-like domain
MKSIFLLYLLLSINFVAYNQVIKGKILDRETKNPIYSAAVYFNGTSLGTLSDAEGNFSLAVLKFSSMPLSVSAVGYYSVTLTKFSAVEPNIIYMNPRTFELDEVVVNDKSHARERKANLMAFRNVFLGTTENAYNCKITNEDDIRFTYSSDRDTLKAFTIKPILIDNKALGYKITYYLDKFTFNIRDSIFLINGEIIFREYPTAIGSRNNSFERNRRSAYLGSRMHFFRALWFNELDSAGFEIKNSANDTLGYKKLVTQYDIHSKYLKYHGRLHVSYGTSEPSSLMIFLKDSILFDPNGFFEPYGIRWEGEMASRRIADMLPYDYSTDQ